MTKEKDTYKPLKILTDIFLYIMLSVFILYGGTNGYAGMFDAKYNMLCIFCGGYIIITFLLLIELILIGEIKLDFSMFIKNMPISQKLVIAYMFITLLSAILSPYFPNTIIGASRNEGVLAISIYCLTFVIISCFGKITRSMIYVFSVVATLFSLICILQLQGMNPLGFYPEGYNFNDAYTAYNGQFLGTIGNTDNVAAFLCLVIPIMLFSLIRLKDKRRFLATIPLILSIYVLVKMWVLAGIVGIIFGTLISIPFSLDLTKKQRNIAMAVILSILIVGVLSIYFSTTNNGLIFEIRELLHGNFDETFGSGRIYIWKSVFNKIPNNIWLGTGPDTMIYANIEPFIRYDVQSNTSFVSQIDIAHNEYLNILFHQGIFAFIAYLCMIVLIIHKLIKWGNKSKTIGILGSALICYLVQGFFGFSSCTVSPLFWILLALILNYSNRKEESI